MHYQDYYSNAFARENFAQTSRIERHTEAERKFMEELLPVQNESAKTYIDRIDINEGKLIEHSIWYHLYGTRKGVWPCHSSSRYCFICNLCQMVEINRQMIIQFGKFVDLDKITINLVEHPESLLPEIQLQKA